MRTELLSLLRCPTTAASLAVEVFDQRGDDVVSGILEAEGESYPIVGGIPVLLPGRDETVALLRQGNYAEAVISALAHDIRPSRVGRAAQALGAVPRAVRFKRVLDQRERRRLVSALAPLIDLSATDPLALIRFGFDEWGARNTEAVNYFTYRYGTPRHLVALACAQVVADEGQLVMDLGCGAGHLTWSLARRFLSGRTIGVDPSLFELWSARHLAPEASFVCGDGSALPFSSRSFDFVIASDVLSFVRGKAVMAREAMRVLSDRGTLAITSVKNARQRHVYAGMPLSPAGWGGLVAELPHRLHSDDRILERYFEGMSPADDDTGDAERAKTVTLLAQAGAPHAPDGRSFSEIPHARGPLGVNPLMRLHGRTKHDVVFRRSFPSESFAADNWPLAEYLPERVVVPRHAVDGDELTRPGVEHLLADTSVLALPAPYRSPRASSRPDPAGRSS